MVGREWIQRTTFQLLLFCKSTQNTHKQAIAQRATAFKCKCGREISHSRQRTRCEKRRVRTGSNALRIYSLANQPPICILLCKPLKAVQTAVQKRKKGLKVSETLAYVFFPFALLRLRRAPNYNEKYYNCTGWLVT